MIYIISDNYFHDYRTLCVVVGKDPQEDLIKFNSQRQDYDNAYDTHCQLFIEERPREHDHVFTFGSEEFKKWRESSEYTVYRDDLISFTQRFRNHMAKFTMSPPDVIAFLKNLEYDVQPFAFRHVDNAGNLDN